MTKIAPSNLAAQLTYRGRGNPWNTQPVTAISNCFPGLEFDFRAIWRRMFEGVVLTEANNLVVEADDATLVGCRLVGIDPPGGGDPFKTGVATAGTMQPNYDAPLASNANKNGVSFMEWSNSLARIFGAQGDLVVCWFTPQASSEEVLWPDDPSGLRKVELKLRRFFETSAVDGAPMANLSLALAEPGELSQGLCSPWQNDYRECACYYWAASRPDYVDVVDGADGVSHGQNWMAVDRSPVADYLLDDRKDPRLLSYVQLFQDWQKYLRFVVGGSDAQDALDRTGQS
jgi:hypothetical protein